jgi:hypothetical protein
VARSALPARRGEAADEAVAVIQTSPTMAAPVRWLGRLFLGGARITAGWQLLTESDNPCGKTQHRCALMTHPKLKSVIAMIAVGLLSFTAGTMAQGRFPQINQAIASLQGALGHMRAAADVYGGHKGTAENLVQQAIGELETAKAFAASHGY